MEFKHTSVLLKESIQNLNIKENGIYVDGTLGGGGHSKEICKHLSQEGILIGIDRDQDALEAAEERLKPYGCEKRLIKGNYSTVKEILRREGIDGIDGGLLDLGVSSFQLDNPERGFSYMQDAPLDMRMDQNQDFFAYHVVNEYSEEEISNIIKKYGEERWAKRIGKFIVEERKRGKIETTFQLVDIIKKAIPAKARREGPHPAKRTFQAIRIEVNNELGLLKKAVEDFLDCLKPGGRLCIITFHSLEDRMVKEVFQQRANPCICPPEFPVCACGKVADIKKVTGKPIIAPKEECEWNPRARSAKLRIAEKRVREHDCKGSTGLQGGT